ncbi:MAG: hypothetical protein HC825_02810 [Oscillatoriales cyanobacterium RM1_1_9]|nr:hypothetical protein [Oscillatoriales cyanobacterium SM2_3_0]NJO47239.1 hypothetical protein [Oscillatoriales cyanobacterium RM2_1_1]NJO70912.1 hypothetical protein [Oscillatoriales cyanobacterium RM1_1_9]
MNGQYWGSGTRVSTFQSNPEDLHPFDLKFDPKLQVRVPDYGNLEGYPTANLG